jgi:hypothetical protein
MTRLLLVAIALSGCGRISFDPRGDAGGDAVADAVFLDVMLANHDEDGDGIDDAIDTCPFASVPQTDRDGDGVGDRCDPEPDNPRQQLATFIDGTSLSGFTFLNGTPSWTVANDDLRFDASSIGSRMEITLGPYEGVAVAMSLDIVSIVGAMAQHQIALHASDDIGAAHTFVELNEEVAYQRWQITDFDGVGNYTDLSSQQLVSAVHPGRIDFLAQSFSDGAIHFEGGWGVAEHYSVDVPTSNKIPASKYLIDFNGMVMDVHYIWIVTW